MEKEHESTSLVALDDEQLNEVAGGCGGWRRHHGGGGGRGWGGWAAWAARHGGGGGLPDIDININIINVSGNTFLAGDDNVLAITAVNAEE